MRSIKNIIWILALFFSYISFSYAESDGKPFKVNGERLDLSPPDNWKLAWMSGDPNKSYFVEYIPENDDINSWKNGYLLIERYPYPPPEILEELAASKMRIATVALIQLTNLVAKDCPDKFEPTSQKIDTFNGLFFAVGGGYCSIGRKITKYGEGAFTAFVEGKDFIYKIQYGWRPQTEAEKRSSPWGIDEKTATFYLESLKSATLCDDSKSNCKNNYLK